MDHKVELLAPAGNLDGFYGAISAGADAVYLAGSQYGARAYADNFSTGELLACIRYAHLLRKKVYLTVNTLVKEAELDNLPVFLNPLVQEGLDGVIVQDFGVLGRIRECFPKLALHASTQMSVTGRHGAMLLKRLGIERIVPARELSLEEVRSLKRETGLEIECFIHGAMCYSYSGQCLFSSILGGRSGNRGRCAQPCRLPYRMTEGEFSGKECYPLSLKDMCTLEILPLLMEAGIDSFKIEGRMKRPEYAAGVTALYRKYMDLCLEGKDAAPSKQDLNKLKELYVRSEVGTGYYFQGNGREMITLRSPAYNGSNELYLAEIKERYLDKKKRLPIRERAFFQKGKPAELWVCSSQAPERWVKVRGLTVEEAAKAPLTRENIINQLTKLGDTPFVMDKEFHQGEPEIILEDGIFYPLKGLNDLRRSSLEMLEEVLLHE